MADHAAEGNAAALGPRPASLAGRLAAVNHGVLAAGALVATLIAIFIVQAPVLGHYFYGDDFVPLADIEMEAPGRYLRDLFLMRDLTPNWRFLTGFYYFVMYKGFELNAMPFLLGSVLVHMGTAALIFWLVWRALDNAWAASIAAALFGISAASVPTVGQVTAFNNVLAAFLLMLAIVALYESIEGRQLALWGTLSVLAFTGAIAANESAAMLAPVLALVAFWRVSQVAGRSRDPDTWRGPAIIAGAHLALGIVAVSSFAACQCTEAAGGEGVFGGGSHVIGTMWTFLGRLLYPIGMDAPGDVGPAHLAASIAVVLVCAIVLVRGPALGRIAVAYMVLALLPYLPIEFALAPRYVYGASVPFAILAAIVIVDVGRAARTVSPALPTLLAVLVLGGLGLHGWQTWEQNQTQGRASEDWRELVDELHERYPTMPNGSKLYVRGGPLVSPLLQFSVLPSVGEVLWHERVFISTVPEATQKVCRAPYDETVVVDYDDGAFTQVPVVTLSEDAPAPAADQPVVAVPCEQPKIGRYR